MKTSTLRNAVSIALVAVATGAAGLASAQEAASDTEPRESAKPEDRTVPAHPPTTTSAAEPAPTELGTITVTGTRIRGGTTPSPVVTIGSERIREEGFADLGEVVRSLPQNFGGGQNPGVAVGATLGVGGLANQNFTGGSSLNLRGLGPDATLTLLNGRRLAYGGVVHAVDIGAIPVEAVDRVEIVPDGASAIYGSDAVGGVGNVVLKRDYQGVAVGLRYGGATEGGLATREYSLTAGTTWPGGGAIAAYKDVSTDPVYARQRSYTDHMFDPNTLYPGSDFRSALLSLHHAVADSVEFRIDALHARRKQEIYQWNTGLRPVYNTLTPETKTSFVAPGLEFSLLGEWTLSVGGSWGRDEHLQDQYQVAVATGARTALLMECYCNEATSYEAGGEGPLFETPGGLARLAAGVGGRRNELVRRDLLGTNQQQAFRGSQQSRFAYAELSLPLMDPGPGNRRLELTAAVRGEDDDDFGRVTTPKLGLVYGPNGDVTFRYSWGKSFKAPTLLQLHLPRSVAVRPVAFYGGQGYDPGATVLHRAGGNPDLKAERASTRTVSLAFHPRSLPGLEGEVTWFDIDYTDRVVQPITDYGRALLIPGYAEFFDYAPTAQRVEEVVASADAFYDYVGGFDPRNVAAIMYAQYVNAARQRIRGVDLSASYRFDAGPGRMTVRGAASWLDSTQQNSAAQPAYDVAGTIFNPARVNGRLGVVWDVNGWSASLFSNYTSGVEDPVAREKTASFTTFDATVRYATEGRGFLSGVEIALSAQNLLDRHPPLYAATTLDRPPYDSTNYSAIGRFLSLAVTKQW
ncbi:TonB-dependent receptor plug domain-containing protein [[Pseudomonas] boreopolis]|uniref:TonB-dependent receptor plug domain-containing protein n=1 Tax=Xanthomonas boreopolis TaxID=86183 RepID=UPI003D9B5B9C